MPVCFVWIFGLVLGLIAVVLAATELGSLPPGREYDRTRRNLSMGRTLGIVGMCLSAGLPALFFVAYFAFLLSLSM